MAIDKTRSLGIMRHCFPSWSDIRKRVKKSTGGSILRAYAEEHGRLNDTLEDYKKIFFLVNYKGHEEEYPDYLYAATVGDVDIDDLAVDSISCEITEDEPTFLADMKNKTLKSDAYLLFHESALGDDKDSILYSVDGSQYRSELVKIPIWNAFDEFAKFAGIERFSGETNKELEARTYAVFKDFPNPTADGLKRAIRDALIPVADIDESAISITPIDETLDLSDEEMANIYEQFVQFNRDLFRTKIWNIDNWENGFQKQGWMPHAWDKPMEITQDGVGSNDSLKISYLRDLDTTGFTDVEVSAYKKDFESVKRYVSKHPVEDAIELTLTKYGDKIEPVKIDYAIRAYDIKRVEHPEDIRINATRTSTGVKSIALEDIVTEVHGVEVQEKGKVDSDSEYLLRFYPKDDYSSMSISKCLLIDGTNEDDVRYENGQYKMVDGVLVNSFVKAHVSEISQFARNDNMVDTIDGMTIGKDKASGNFDIDVKGMENELVTWKATCRETSIMGTSYISCSNGFEYDKDKSVYTDSLADSLGTVIIGGKGNEMTCNSFSFALEKAANASKQGAVMVTIDADGEQEKVVLRTGGRFSRSYKKRTKTCIIIQKYGQNAVSIKDIRMSSYDIDLSMSDGTPLKYLNDTVRLPSKITGRAVLRVNVIPYISASPVLEYVHVGGSLRGACCELQFNTEDLEHPKLDIKTDCDVTLYKMEGGRPKVIGQEKQYTTENSYYNPYDEAGQIVVNLSEFSSIENSSPVIESKYEGGKKTYITLNGGESMSRISVSGSITEVVSSKSLLSYAEASGKKASRLYFTKADRGIIMDAGKDGISSFTIPHAQIGRSASKFQVVGLPDGVVAYFVYGDGSMQEITASALSTSFDSIVLSYDAAKEYIAYNSTSMVSQKTSVGIVNTFQPVLSLTEEHLYEIDPPLNPEHKAKFQFMETKTLRTIESGDKIEITVEEELKNKGRWPLDVKRVIDRCVLSNEILLDKQYLVDGTYHELSEYIIETPKGLELNYGEPVKRTEKTTVPETGILKLRYSNVSGITVYIDGLQKKYGFSVMNEEGIIIWEDDFLGKDVELQYSVKEPSYLVYSKEYEDKLYELVDNNTDALKLVSTKKFSGAKDKDTFQPGFDTADVVVTKCSNPAFTSIYQNGIVSVIQLRDDEHIAVKSGYIYDAGQEYYRFNDTHHEDVEQADSIEFHNVSRQENDMLFHMKSCNYLPCSDMRTDAMTSLCHFDFTKDGSVKGASRAGRMTSCESYNLWYLVDMNASLTETAYGTGISFVSEGGTGYAALDITKYAQDDTKISFFKSGSLSVFLVKEELVDGMPFLKSVFLDMGRAEAFVEEYGFVHHALENVEEGCRVYLVLSGTSGSIDDIVIADSSKNIATLHEKNIKRFGIDIKERFPKRYECDLEFTRDGAVYEDTVCESDGTITTSTSVEYGLTEIDDAVLTDCAIHNADYKNGKITTVRQNAEIKTRHTFIRSSSSVYAVYVKVNSILDGKRKGFDIEVYMSSHPDGGYTLAASGTGTNLVTVTKNNIKSYMYVVIRAKSGKVIDSVETYARYAESETSDLVSIPKESGYFISKVYEMDEEANYKFAGMDAEINNNEGDVQCQVRGFKKNDDASEFTDWKNEGEILEGYSMFQFRVKIIGDGASVKINSFRMVAS